MNKFIFFILFILLSSKSFSQWWVDGGNLIWPYGKVTINKQLSVQHSQPYNYRLIDTMMGFDDMNPNVSYFIGSRLSWQGILNTIQYTAKGLYPSPDVNYPYMSIAANEAFQKGDSLYHVLGDRTSIWLVPESGASWSTRGGWNYTSIVGRRSNVVLGEYVPDFFTSSFSGINLWESYIDENNTLTVDTVKNAQVKGYTFRFGSGNKKRYETVNSFYSDLSSYSASTKILNGNAYHFFGSGNYPAWFGGTINSGAGFNFASDTSSTDDYKIVLKGAHTLTAGLEVTFKTTSANTDGATLQVNSLTAKNLTKKNSSGVNIALNTGDILAGQVIKCVYDGTQFQIISGLAALFPKKYVAVLTQSSTNAPSATVLENTLGVTISWT